MVTTGQSSDGQSVVAEETEVDFGTEPQTTQVDYKDIVIRDAKVPLFQSKLRMVLYQGCMDSYSAEKSFRRIMAYMQNPSGDY